MRRRCVSRGSQPWLTEQVDTLNSLLLADEAVSAHSSSLSTPHRSEGLPQGPSTPASLLPKWVLGLTCSGLLSFSTLS